MSYSRTAALSNVLPDGSTTERERESVAVGESLEVQLGGAVVRRAQQEDGGRKNGENGREGAGLCLD